MKRRKRLNYLSSKEVGLRSRWFDHRFYCLNFDFFLKFFCFKSSFYVCIWLEFDCVHLDVNYRRKRTPAPILARRLKRANLWFFFKVRKHSICMIKTLSFFWFQTNLDLISMQKLWCSFIMNHVFVWTEVCVCIQTIQKMI